MGSAPVMSCAIGIAGSCIAANAANAQDAIGADIMSGYASDAWFADDQNTASLKLKAGLHFRNSAIVVPNIKAIDLETLDGLHNAN